MDERWRGAPRERDGGLGAFTIEVPDAADLAAIAERLDTAGHSAEVSDQTLSVEDPWGNLIHIRVAAA